MQTTDISTEEFLEAMKDVEEGLAGLVNRWELTDRLGCTFEAVGGKAQELIDAGVIVGCACGCRGDFVETGV